MKDINRLKKIITSIIENEARDNKLNVSLNITTTNEYTKKESKLVYSYLLPAIYGITNTEDNHIDIFIDNILSNYNISPLFKAIETSYHESRHLAQTKINPNTYEGFFYLIDNYVLENTLTKEPKNTFEELDAYLYGSLKAKEYLLINKKDEYYNNKQLIEELITKNFSNYNSINLTTTVEEFISILKKKTIMYSIFNLKNIPDINEISPILNIFMKDTTTFKTLKEILSDKRVGELDKRIVYAFISNKYFLKTIDFNNLTNLESSILKDSLIYTKETYLNQYNILDSKISLDNIDAINIAKHQNKLLATIKSIEKTLTKLNKPSKKKLKQRN